MEHAALALAQALAADPAVSDATRAAAKLLADAAQSQIDDVQHDADVWRARADAGLH